LCQANGDQADSRAALKRTYLAWKTCSIFSSAFDWKVSNNSKRLELLRLPQRVLFLPSATIAARAEPANLPQPKKMLPYQNGHPAGDDFLQLTVSAAIVSLRNYGESVRQEDRILSAL